MKSQVKLFLIQLLFDKKITFFPNIDNEEFWNTLVKLSSAQIIVPAVFFKLKQRDLLDKIPNELNQYLQNIYSLNESRNKVLVDELTFIENELNINNIDFVFLKGSYLLRTIYSKNIGIRMMHDIDILIEKNQIQTAKKIFLKLNYCNNNFDYKILGSKKHIPRLVNKNKNIGIELHFKLTDRKKNFFDNENLLKNKFKSHLSLKNNLNHLILNSELNDKGALLGKIFLRSIFDFFNLNDGNHFDFDKHFYSKVFYNKLYYLKIVSAKENLNYFYLSYLLVINTKFGRIIPFLFLKILKLKFIPKKSNEYVINLKYRKKVHKTIKSYFGK
ncbi:MAG: hypothetical protein CMC28_01145 [Flavobacteriaceae bacterium]|nr:hypothetical protein [Flavobacteriaceae bacterium]|tara:strand:- start:2518 stop:3507 length:990 start_codon:yes stop_codon:yes gene_type:complete